MPIAAKALAVPKLYEDLKRRIPDLTRSQYAIRALDWIFEQPIFTAPQFVTRAGIPSPTARRFLGVLADGEVLRTLRAGRGRRASVLAFPALLNIVEGATVFP